MNRNSKSFSWDAVLSSSGGGKRISGEFSGVQMAEQIDCFDSGNLKTVYQVGLGSLERLDRLTMQHPGSILSKRRKLSRSDGGVHTDWALCKPFNSWASYSQLLRDERARFFDGSLRLRNFVRQWQKYKVVKFISCHRKSMHCVMPTSRMGLQ